MGVSLIETCFCSRLYSMYFKFVPLLTFQQFSNLITMCTAATTGKKFAKERWLLLIMAKQFIHKFLQTAQCGTTSISIKKGTVDSGNSKLGFVTNFVY